MFFDLNVDAFVGAETDWVVDHFLKLLDGMIADPDGEIAKLPLVTSATSDRSGMAEEVQPNEAPRATTVIKAFERQAAATPRNIAVVCGDDTLIYTELNDRANRLAQELRRRGVGAGVVVGVAMDRSVEAVVSIIGILKAGAAFLPIDPGYPDSRVEFVVEDAAVRLVLTLGDSLPCEGVEALDVTGDFWQGLAEVNGNPPTRASADELAYIIYTSGSTGFPKGVMVGHGSVANYVLWAADRYTQGKVLAFPLFSSLAFDLTVTSIFVPLVSGGRIVVYPAAADEGDITLHKILADDLVDIIKLTPSHLALLQGMDLAGSRVKQLILGGEDLKTDIARTITRRFGGDIKIYNEYGPTEATVGCMIHRFDPDLDTDISVPIGHAIDNLRVHVLDEHGNTQPQGVTGEIFIAGAGVAKGYLNQEEVTRAKFVDNPFRPGEIMYATGDLARMNHRGQLEYLGREDHQVKIRGVRIELGEVESTLLRHEAIKACVVDLLERHEPAPPENSFCVQCGLSARHPDAHLDHDGVCRICRLYADVRTQSDTYFRDFQDLEAIAEKARECAAGEQDCLMLLSGGKDSTYALCRLVDLGFTPLVFTLDNGFISDGAKENIRRVVDQLGLELVIGKTAAMNEIFVDSLNRFSNVCNGCFKTIYTLAMNLAHERGIKYILTGLSRGQIFETRIAGMFQQQVFDPVEIDRTIVEARKAYHRMDDAVSRALDVSIFEKDEIFDEIEFVDFYRYCDTTLDELYAYLAERVPWIRPRDTGRSTNCRINELGIFVHTRERGFHNYALPYSWDVRLGHKERDAALKELDDNIDVNGVQKMLGEIGYHNEVFAPPAGRDKILTAYYVSEDTVGSADLRSFLSGRLPAEFIPDHFIELDEI
ncbi:MAG: amino acid adenylation domain-containing protein, partial [Proteobacteria bacterium]|nr:amino acid adenylation domain-containing protein [Pseudomonadota bacterium]